MTDASPHPHAQSKYQVRFDWGRSGAVRIGTDADIVVWVDVLGGADDGAPTALFAELPQAEFVEGGLTDAAVVAARVLDLQVRLGRRVLIGVVAAGAPDRGDGQADDASDALRFTVEDLLGAGAVIDALASVGLDYCSPEAAAACAAFTGLRGAVAHLATASAGAQELLAAGVAAAEIRRTATLGSSEELRVLRLYPA
ncbi:MULTISPECIES: hypothetical protein [unclassified Leifsonia]|uniref:hypothetical protein n=1 Tax=unclassified Leifsonia TaxID=2663824 RepID=UPI0012FA3209|nr:MULTISPECIES: hypothetical protein [unclassified Leifsonia]